MNFANYLTSYVLNSHTKKICRDKGWSWGWAPAAAKLFHSESQAGEFFLWRLQYCNRSSLVVHMVMHLPTVQETWVWSLGREDPLEKEMATHSSTFAWKIPWREGLGRLQSMGSQRVRHDWAISFFLSHLYGKMKKRHSVQCSARGA